MNKKILSLLIIISIITVGLASISAADNVVSNTPESNVINTGVENQQETVTENDTNLTNSTNDTKDYPDVVVPTNVEDLHKFQVYMNFVTPDGKEYFADQLAQIDNLTYKDVITALKNNDMEHLFYYVGQLEQNKIDTFFSTFVNIFDTSNQGNSNKNNTDLNSITNTISNILGSSSEQKTVGNHFISPNPKLTNSNTNLNQNNQTYTFKGKQYNLFDFITTLKNAYEKDEISYDQLIQILEENGFDTSEIKLDDGIVRWGFLNMIPGNSTEDISEDTNLTSDNSTTNNSQEQTLSQDSTSSDVSIQNDASNIKYTA